MGVRPARAKEAERALEMACLARFGTLRPRGEVPIIRSDNGLIFQSRRLGDACRFYRLPQEFITPYTPEQNGLIERWFRSLKEECVWQQQFRTFADARTAITAWIAWGNEGRPHQALGYRIHVSISSSGGTPPPWCRAVHSNQLGKTIMKLVHGHDQLLQAAVAFQHSNQCYLSRGRSIAIEPGSPQKTENNARYDRRDGYARKRHPVIQR